MRQMNTFSARLRVFSLIAIPLGALLIPGAPLFADGQSEVFSKLDKNSDGVLEAGEVGSSQKILFERLLRQGDANDDGKISLQEFEQATKPAQKESLESKLGQGKNQRRPGGNNKDFDPEKVFNFLDTNQDGKLVRSEIPQRAKERTERLFDRLEKDEITKAEFLKTTRQFRKQGGPKPGRLEGRQSKEMFKRLDANKDGKVTMNELPERFRPKVVRYLQQNNKDPKEGLTPDELKKITAKRGQKGVPQKKKKP